MPPSPGSWNPAWEEVAALVVVALVYGSLVRTYGISRLRRRAFDAALLIALVAVVSPLATLARHYFLWAHLLQNVALAEWAPALAVLGLSPAAAAAVARRPAFSALARPLVALPLWLATYGVWHVPALYDAALRHRALLDLEHASYVVTGFLFWWPVFQALPQALRAGGKAAYLFGAFVLASPLGLVLALFPTPLYDFYESAPRLWGLQPLADQQIGGVIMAVSEGIVFFALFAYFFVRFMAEEEAGYSPGDA
ncbi:MAG TPA: cytochrome c oxidase assembly protein [Gaiellaceae bacterium]|nr:cytochrome c oxidase assembly protein [Gaiellaceae bacterium]